MSQYVEAINERFKGSMSDMIGMRITYADPKRLVGELEVRPDLRQIYGYIHGGALMTMMDSLAGAGSALNIQPGDSFITVEFKVNFLRSVRSGRVRAEANAVHIGRRTHVWQVSAYDEQDRQMALATLTQLVIEPRPEATM
jgi:1,4-dihydroxy-2-naphthoyl-CoA hydrolase